VVVVVVVVGGVVVVVVGGVVVVGSGVVVVDVVVGSGVVVVGGKVNVLLTVGGIVIAVGAPPESIPGPEGPGGFSLPPGSSVWKPGTACEGILIRSLSRPFRSSRPSFNSRISSITPRFTTSLLGLLIRTEIVPTQKQKIL
jgi:hypothetical protein